MPSNRVLLKYPSLICHARRASQCPVVGSALNWQGQPQLQLQLPTSSPAICHLIFVGSLIFLLLHNAPPPSRGISCSGCVFERIPTEIYSGLLLHIARFCFNRFSAPLLLNTRFPSSPKRPYSHQPFRTLADL